MVRLHLNTNTLLTTATIFASLLPSTLPFTLTQQIPTSSLSSLSSTPFSKSKKQNTRNTHKPLLLPLCLGNNDDDESPLPELTNGEIARYSRHLVLGDVGMIGQKKLKNASVLTIGAGGLGSPCLLYLAAAGVGTIGIVDADVVDESNLQRQIIHGTSTINKSKCQSAYERIQDINPNVNVILYEEEFTSSSALRILEGGKDLSATTTNGNTNAEHYYSGWDVVIDGSDNFPTKYLINDACDIMNIPWVYSAILAFEGQLSVFNYNKGPTYRDMMPVPPPPGDVPSCAEGGVLGVLPGTMGCLQATEALKIILDDGSSKSTEGIMSGRILVYDALKMKFSEAGLNKLEGREEITELIDYQGFCAGPSTASSSSSSSSSDVAPDSQGEGGRTMDETLTSSPSDVDLFHGLEPSEALEKLKQGWSPWVVDVRLQTEHDIVALPFTDVVSPHRTVRIDQVPTDGDIFVYCKAGIRGKKACRRLIELGVDPQRLYNLDGGIMGWRREIDTSMPRY